MFAHTADGLVPRVKTDASVVLMKRDSLGRVVRERVNGRSVDSQYDGSDRTFKRKLAAAMGAFAAAMVASTTPSFAAGQLPREEPTARVYQWRGEDQISAVVDATSGP
jgi:hypothetical protein